MKKLNRLLTIGALASLATFSFTSCNNDDEEPVVWENIERSELIFTEVTGGASLYPHGDHFHGLGGAVEGESRTISFNSAGVATEGGHIHLDPEGIYKVQLRAWDFTGREVQQDFLADKATASRYKAFLVGAPFVLNQNTEDQSGAIFQPREMEYVDGTAVAGALETTGILTYITLGESNEGEFAVTYVLRNIDPGVKENITRGDWNHADYATRFAGSNVVELKFEIHAEHDH
ncbi:hypothetical protein [Anditalea andensis]|uniref:Lipoprotein n=1 Tax=Anditalea andensis TaxID=1048983 RepID=A0A074KTJ0_9BACT|nr:hypothetical protein [Anditalea andensis]KEO72209.1 hypothetical protein EL17_20105 [Anditalea andensis]